MSFDRGPGQGPTYSGNFTTQGGALYAGDGQNAGRDIINIFAEVVYLSRKKKESAVLLKPDQRSAWRDFRKALQTLGVNPIALTEQQAGMLLKSIAEITGQKGGSKPEKLDTASPQPTQPQPGDPQPIQKSKDSPSISDSSEDSETDDSSSCSEYSDAQEDTADTALPSPAIIEQTQALGFSGRNRQSGPVQNLQVSRSDSRKITREQISILEKAIQGVRRQYPLSNRPKSDEKALDASLRESSIQNASEIVGMPIQAPHILNDSLLDKEKSSFFAALQPLPAASPIDKEDWKSLKDELKEFGISVILVSDKSRGQPSSFGHSEQQSFREWCLAKTVSASETDDRCPPRVRHFMKAVRDDDEIEARVLIWRGANVNAKMTERKSALHVAVEKKSLSMVRLLMQNGANVEQLDLYGVSPLHQAAAASDHFEIIDALLSQGGSINVRGYEDWQPIHVATIWGHTSTLKAIISKGADVNSITISRSTALMLAASEGRASSVQILLDEGADIDMVDERGKSALSYALNHPSADTFRLLLDRGAAVDTMDFLGKTILHKVAATGDESMVKMLLDRDAPIDVSDHNLITPLHVAAFFGHDHVMKLLLPRCSRFDGLDIHGCTPLHVAASQGHARVLKLLLQHGATPYTYDNQNYSPLEHAIRSDVTEAVQVLLEHGVTFNDQCQWPAIYIAARRRNETMVRFLIGRGANVEPFPRIDDMNALLYAVHDGSLPIVEALLSPGGANIEARRKFDGMTALNIAAMYSHRAILEFLLKNGADVNSVDYMGANALNRAAKSGSVSISRLLIENGIKADQEALDGGLPLIIAICYGSHRVVQLLLKEKGEFTLDEIQDALKRMQDASPLDIRDMKQILLTKFPDLELGIDSDLKGSTDDFRMHSRKISELRQTSQTSRLDMVPYRAHTRLNGFDTSPTIAPSEPPPPDHRDPPAKRSNRRPSDFVYIIEEPCQSINNSNTKSRDRPSGARRRRSEGSGLQQPKPEETVPRNSRHRSKKKRPHRTKSETARRSLFAWFT